MAEPSFRHKGSWMQLPISSDVKLQSNMEGGDSRKHLVGGGGRERTTRVQGNNQLCISSSKRFHLFITAERIMQDLLMLYQQLISITMISSVPSLCSSPAWQSFPLFFFIETK